MEEETSKEYWNNQATKLLKQKLTSRPIESKFIDTYYIDDYVYSFFMYRINTNLTVFLTVNRRQTLYCINLQKRHEKLLN